MSITTPQVDDDAPRRGGRVRKAVERYNPPARVPATDADDDDEEGREDQEMSSEDEVERGPRNGKKRTSTGNVKRVPRPVQRKRKEPGNGRTAAGPAAEVQEGFKDDCPLFNALLSPDIAIQQVIEDWVETYEHTANDEVSERASVHELILFCIRCCGLSADIDEDEAMDEDGIVDTIERIQDESVQTAPAAYPLISKAKTLRSFKTNLNLFIPHLIKSLSLTPLLFETRETTAHTAPILSLLLSWLHSMSSSTIRPIRHTSTFLGLKINSALCDVVSTVSGDLSLRQRQRDAEAKKGGQGPAAQKRLKDLQAKVDESLRKKGLLEATLKDSFQTLFVHRVRDADPAIRTDCMKELGVWVKKYGDMFITTANFSYFNRGTNDPDARARLETVKALPNLFHNDHHLNRARVGVVRLVPRLVEMALRDVDLSVRVHAISLITQIEKTGILADDHQGQRQRIARLLFDNEPRVRKAVAEFIHSLRQEKIEALETQWSGAKQAKKKRAGNVSAEEMEYRFGYKALAELLVEISHSLDQKSRPESSRQAGSGAMTSSARLTTRAKAAVEALWTGFAELTEWQSLVEYLSLDHSQADDMWLLEEEEENMLLQVLVECVRRDDEEDEEDQKTKTLMDVIPKLFTKHQADPERMGGLLSIIEQMKLSVYLDMRKTSGYESLWDDVAKQFLQHTDPYVLSAAMKAINHLAANESMSTMNSTKLLELEESVFSTLRQAINGEDVFSMSMDEDTIATLQGILLRITLLQRSRDIAETVESEEGGQSSGWEIVLAFAERGEMGFKEEAKIVEYAIQIIFLHMTWLFKKFTVEDEQDEMKKDSLQTKLNKAAEIFSRLALKGRGNPVEIVRQQAFISFINLHMLFSDRGPEPLPAAKACPHVMRDEIQNQLGQAFASIAERYLSDKEESTEAQDEDDQEVVIERSRKDLLFIQLVSVFVGAIRCGVLDMDHAKEPLAHYGHFGPTYDAVTKKLVDVLREEGIYNKQADTVQHVAQSALEASFNAFLESEDDEPTATIALAKVIATSFVVQGTHFTVLRSINPTDICDLHVSALDYLGKKLSNYQRRSQLPNAGSKKSKARVSAVQEQAQKGLDQSLSFFKVLVLLLAPINGRGALSIRQKMDDIWRESQVRPDNKKQWEAWRTYDRRLLNIASKDSAVRVVTQPRQATEIEEGTERGDDEEGAPTERGDEPDEEVVGEVEEVEVEAATEEEFGDGGPMTSTPQAKTNNNNNRRRSRPADLDDEEQDDVEHEGDEAVPFADRDVNVNVDEEGDGDIDIDEEFDGMTSKAPAGSARAEPLSKRRKVRK